MLPTWAEKFRGFLELLEKTKTWHQILRNQEDAITLLVALPGFYYEVDFLFDGTIEVQEFEMREITDVDGALGRLASTVARDLEDEADQAAEAAMEALGLRTG